MAKKRIIIVLNLLLFLIMKKHQFRSFFYCHSTRGDEFEYRKAINLRSEHKRFKVQLLGPKTDQIVLNQRSQKDDDIIKMRNTKRVYMKSYKVQKQEKSSQSLQHKRRRELFNDQYSSGRKSNEKKRFKFQFLSSESILSPRIKCAELKEFFVLMVKVE